jgi:hypothetical protein
MYWLISFEESVMTQLNLFETAPQTNNLTKTQEVAHAFMRYARMNQIKPNTKAYRWAEHAFLTGVGSALGEDMPPLLSICLASGRSLESIIERTQPR